MSLKNKAALMSLKQTATMMSLKKETMDVSETKSDNGCLWNKKNDSG